jgi:alkylresorcinol/alkylpyrone synthase
MPNPIPAPRLVALATAVPDHVLRQSEVVERARLLFHGRIDDFARLLPVYGNAGIETRHSCVPLDWYGRPVGWRERNELYLQHALDLIERVARRCLDRASLPASAVDALVTVSSTGVATPSLDARLMERLPFRRDVERLPIFGLGCAGGALGLARAAALAQAKAGVRVLLLVVELCGITFRSGDSSKSNVVASALFADGAAAVLVSSADGDEGPRITGWGEYTWPDSLDVMGWRVEDDGLGVLFSRDIPTIIRRDYAAALDAFLIAQGVGRAALGGLALHPGGTKVVEALEDVFGLPRGGLAEARDVLRRFGNMSAPTVLFVLQQVLRELRKRPILVSALGPGFTAAFVTLLPQAAMPSDEFDEGDGIAALSSAAC